MLVVGKLAVLPRTRRRQYAAQRRQCSRVLEETLRIPGARAGLDAHSAMACASFSAVTAAAFPLCRSDSTSCQQRI